MSLQPIVLRTFAIWLLPLNQQPSIMSLYLNVILPARLLILVHAGVLRQGVILGKAVSWQKEVNQDRNGARRSGRLWAWPVLSLSLWYLHPTSVEERPLYSPNCQAGLAFLLWRHQLIVPPPPPGPRQPTQSRSRFFEKPWFSCTHACTHLHALHVLHWAWSTNKFDVLTL